MKKIYCLAPCCLLAAGFASCSDDDDNKGNNNNPPTTGDLGIQFPVTSVTGYDNSYFRYENGRLASGYSDGDPFTISQNPPAIRISYESDNESYVENYTDIRLNASGYATFANYSATDTYEGETEHYSGTANMQYDQDGHITQKSVSIREGNFFEDSYTISYTWQNGNLTRIRIDETYREYDETERYVEIYEYTYAAPTENPNSGIYLYDMWYATYDFMWYAGLFGKTTRNIPVGMTYTYTNMYDDGTTSEYSQDYVINTQYNDNGSVARIEYRQPGSSYADEVFVYGYDGIIPDAAQPRIWKKTADEGIFHKGPAFRRQR